MSLLAFAKVWERDEGEEEENDPTADMAEEGESAQPGGAIAKVLTDTLLSPVQASGLRFSSARAHSKSNVRRQKSKSLVEAAKGEPSSRQWVWRRQTSPASAKVTTRATRTMRTTQQKSSRSPRHRLVLRSTMTGQTLRWTPAMLLRLLNHQTRARLSSMASQSPRRPLRLAHLLRPLLLPLPLASRNRRSASVEGRQSHVHHRLSRPLFSTSPSATRRAVSRCPSRLRQQSSLALAKVLLSHALRPRHR